MGGGGGGGGGANQVSGRVSVPCWHATPIANAPWKPLIIGEGQARYQGHEIGGMKQLFDNPKARIDNKIIC